MHNHLLARAIICSALTLVHASRILAEPLNVSLLPAGYTTSSIELGQPYAGTLAFDPANLNRLYASTGFFGNQSILRVDILAGTTSTVATGLGSVGGIAVLSNGDVAITENGTSQSIFRARDLTADGEFLDPGEITQLIAPILADSGFGFTGAQIAVAPAGNASGIPAGSLIIQTADGGTSGELLIVEDPSSATPAFRPLNGAYFSGLSYNGGIAFDAAGNLIVGESLFPDGRIHALVNSNADEDIDIGEHNILVPGASIPTGIADLAVSNDARVFFGGNGSSFGVPDAEVRTFALPGNLLTGTGTPATFAITNATYLWTMRFDDPARSFLPAAATNTARLTIGGLNSAFSGFTNLLVIVPSPTSSISDWRAFE